tara:strand:+ start:7607 stop:7975 length:369 start_codon:yes stop_codon:yes gene_type:complete
MNKVLMSLFVIFIVGCTSGSSTSPGLYDGFAQCLSDTGVKIYGSFLCSVCKSQRDLFGSSFEKLGEIECHPQGENPQTELCLERDIAKTPTWILEKDNVEVKRLEGFQSLETLSEFSGCSLN